MEMKPPDNEESPTKPLEPVEQEMLETLVDNLVPEVIYVG